MEEKRCFDPSCMLDVEYVCQCTSPQIYSCEVHLGKHLKLPNRTHNFDTLFSEAYEGTKEAILEALTKENSKNSKLKEKILASFNQRFFESKNDLEELMRSLNSTSDVISNYFSKISEANKISKSELDPILGLLSLPPKEALEKVKLLIPNNSDWNNSAKIFCGFNEKIEQMIECFIKDKFEAHLDKRLAKIESVLEEHDKYIYSENNKLANVTDSIFEIANENKMIKQEFENWEKEIDKIKINQESLINSKFSDVKEDLNRRLQQLEMNQKAINIFVKSLIDNKSEILSRPNCPEIEMTFREMCSKYRSNFSGIDPKLIKAYQDYTSTYHNKTSLYNLAKKDNNTNLLIYNTETEKHKLIILKNQQLNNGTCLTQIPNGKLFCFGKKRFKPNEIHSNNDQGSKSFHSGIGLIIDESGEAQKLLCDEIPCHYTSCIYYNENIYCFGGKNYLTRNHHRHSCLIMRGIHAYADILDRKRKEALDLSLKYDFWKHKFFCLKRMPQADFLCNSVIFNGSILISGYLNKNLLQYCIENDSFIIIPYEFAVYKRKILINAKRLYLIECSGFIYESEIESYANWRQIGDSIIRDIPKQVYCSYNKGGIYIGYNSRNTIRYYKFNLDDKSLTELI